MEPPLVAAPTQSVFGYTSLLRGLANRTLNGVMVDRVWYSYNVEGICLISHGSEVA
jgi:hypothetical protein